MRTEDQLDWREAYDRIYMGIQFRYRREQLGLEAEIVAEEAGYSLTQYTLMEEGKRQITVGDYFRIADVWYSYEDAEYPAFERKLRQAWRTLKRQFLLWELQIEMVFPDAKSVFDTIPLRVIVFFFLVSGPFLMLFGTRMSSGDGGLFYYLGYALGSFYRIVADVIG